MLKSDRLRFETWTVDDADLLFDLHADPKVQTGYVLGPEKWTRPAIEKRLKDYMVEQAKFGVTKWKLMRHDGMFIGRAGWSPWEAGSLELGYAIKSEFWNQGYATEAASALLQWAKHNRPRTLLIGFALPDNQPSRSILERIGMAFLGYREIGGGRYAYYHVPQ